ncbi:phosphodiester glycosidase family protein [Terrimonas sp. NA20]|uniref:Phosphodiester glycosidase family protein n=1 Tax=Terrimonas ginsenosidimutans TaxID=2908004 RepID=A0ABS9KRU8_9BACT|nr:phosphodiester glycosidase family protein [Terrimonas ginsenosidimutans]MCG2615028.1 phosphodiester glycosidase family protein [Terrimonas ginsenosidimutans]
MKRIGLILSVIIVLVCSVSSMAQNKMNWVNVDSAFGPLPSSVHVFRSADLIDGKPNIAYYVIAALKDKDLHFTADTTLARRFTPKQFYERNEKPLVVVNTTFFSFATNQNLNTVIMEGKQVGFTVHSIPGKGKDTLTYFHPFGSALGISKKRKADIAWLYTDSLSRWPLSWDHPVEPKITTTTALRPYIPEKEITQMVKNSDRELRRTGDKWKMQTAVGGGPVVVKDGTVSVSNNSEMKFSGKAIDDKHPRTAMGYTRDNKLIILVIEGRNPGVAEGASLTQEALILQQLGCWEALNLDGGGSSCLLVNGKETIRPSDKGVERPVPAVFIIK